MISTLKVMCIADKQLDMVTLKLYLEKKEVFDYKEVLSGG